MDYSEPEPYYPNTTSKKANRNRGSFLGFRRHLSNEGQDPRRKSPNFGINSNNDYSREENSVFHELRGEKRNISSQNYSYRHDKRTFGDNFNEKKKQKSENLKDDGDLLIKFKAIENEFLGHLKPNMASKRFASPLDSNSTTVSLISSVKVKQETKNFFESITTIVEENERLANKIDLIEIKKIIYKDLDELIADEDEIDIGKLIGKGASSEVFFGNFRFCPCAIKKINLELVNSKQFKFLFNELSCLRKLRHPNIVMIIGIIVTEGKDLLIVTELCEQQSLKKFIKKYRGKTPNNVKLRIMFDIAKAIYYMHNNKPQIIHRDLKPENVFLSSDLKAKIGDFGIARINQLTETYNMNTETVSTLQYMAPESMQKGVYSTKGDIYSFGIIAYEILYEEEAFENLEGFDLINSVVTNNLRPNMDCKFGGEIRQLLESCWDPEPSLRPDAEVVCRIMMKLLKNTVRRR